MHYPPRGRSIAMLLMIKEVKEALQSGKLVMRPFFEDSLQATTYDANLGCEFFIPNGKEGKLGGGGPSTVVLKAGQFALFMTEEYFELALDIAGHIGPKASVARLGGLLLHGTEIDPGFKGHLRFGFYNASPQDLVLEAGKPICQIEFYQLRAKVPEAPPENKDLIEGRIPLEDKRLLMRYDREGLPALSQKVTELTRDVGELSHSVGKLTDNVGTLSTRMKELREDIRAEITNARDDSNKAVSRLSSCFWAGFYTILALLITILITLALK